MCTEGAGHKAEPEGLAQEEQKGSRGSLRRGQEEGQPTRLHHGSQAAAGPHRVAPSPGQSPFPAGLWAPPHPYCLWLLLWAPILEGGPSTPLRSGPARPAGRLLRLHWRGWSSLWPRHLAASPVAGPGSDGVTTATSGRGHRWLQRQDKRRAPGRPCEHWWGLSRGESPHSATGPMPTKCPATGTVPQGSHTARPAGAYLGPSCRPLQPRVGEAGQEGGAPAALLRSPQHQAPPQRATRPPLASPRPFRGGERGGGQRPLRWEALQKSTPPLPPLPAKRGPLGSRL